MTTGTTLEQALQDYLKARAADPWLTPEEFCDGSPHLLRGLQHVLQAITTSGDRTATTAPPPGADAPAVAAPRTLGVYAIQRKLGEGGMGTVYLAMDTRLDRPAAVKVMRPQIASEPLARARFLREAKAMAAVKHDHVAAIYSANEEADGTTWLAMELLEGEALDDAVKRGVAFDWPTIYRLGRETALGLHAAHAKKLIHRDIKPANIWLEAPGAKVKILDFGLARQSESDAELTGTGAVLGTPAYMAPEQASGEPVDHRCDLFSLGVLLYRLTTGKLPFCGPTALATITALVTREPTPVPALRPDCPAGLADLIGRLLAKDRDRRPPTAQAVADELLALAGDGASAVVTLTALVVAVPAADPWVGLDDGAAAAPTATLPDARRGGPPRKPRRWLFALPLALLLVVCGVVVKIRNKDGTVTEIRVPDGATVEVVDGAGKTLAQVPPKKGEPKAATPPVAAGEAIDYTAERKAAEGLLNFKVSYGSFTLADVAGRELATLAVGHLKAALPDTPFYVRRVNTQWGRGAVTDEVTLAVAACANLEELDLDGCSVTDAGLGRLTGLRHLKRLGLSSCGGVGDGAIDLAVRNPDLESVSLWDTQVTDPMLRELVGCPRLRGFTPPLSMTGDTLRHLGASLPLLRGVNIQYHPVSASDLVAVKRLQDLHCDSGHLTGAAVEALAGLAHFERLKVLFHQDTAALTRLKPLAGQLRSLEISFGNDWLLAGSARLQVLRDFRELQNICFSFHPARGLNDAGLETLSGLPNLRKIRVQYANAESSNMTPQGLRAFRRLRPDVELTLLSPNATEHYPALADWPGKGDGSAGVAPWALPKDAPPPAVVPFSAAEAAKHQEAWAKYVKQPVEVENKLGMKFRLIPPGESDTLLASDMAQPPEEGGAGYWSRIPGPYYLGTTGVTVSQFKAFVEATRYETEVERGVFAARPTGSWSKPPHPTEPTLPVSFVSPADAAAFCKWLSSVDGAQYRLPTEVEWEWAARGGGQGSWTLGRTPEEQEPYVTTVRPDPLQPSPVGKRRSNAFGLHDLLGNMWDICHRVEAGDPGAAVRGGSYIYRGSGVGHVPAVRSIQMRIRYTGETLWIDSGFRVLRQATNEPLTVAKFGEKPVMVGKGQPLSAQATVSRPAAIPGVRSWSVELAGQHGINVSVAWSPKGDVIASAGWHDQSVRLWDREGNLKRVLLGHAGAVMCVAFSPDGTRLATGEMIQSDHHTSRGAIRIWEVATGKCLSARPTAQWVQGVAFSPDGNEVAACGTPQYAEVIRLETGATRPLPVNSNCAQLSWSPDGKTLAVATEGGSITLWDATTTAAIGELIAPEKLPVGGFSAFSPDGKLLASCGGDTLRVWDAKTLKQVKAVEAKRAYRLEWHKGGNRIAVVAEGRPIEIVDLQAGTAVAVATQGGVDSAAWSPDGTELVVMQGSRPTFYDAATGQAKRQPPDRGGGSSAAFATPDLRRVMCEAGGRRREFDADTGELLAEPAAPGGTPVAAGPAREWVATAGDNEATVTHADGKSVRLDAPGRGWWRADAAGAKLCGVFDKRVVVWGVRDGHRLASFDHPTAIRSLEWSPDGKRLATAGDDKVLRLWDAATGKLVRAFDKFPKPLDSMGGLPIAWNPDNRGLWVPMGQDAAQLDTETGRVSPPVNFSNGNLIESIALAADGDSLLVGEGYGWTFLRDRDGTRRLLGQHLGAHHGLTQWHPDARRFVGVTQFGLRGFDTRRDHRLGTLWPAVTGDHWLCVGPDGHYRGSKGVESQFVYAALLDDGRQQTYTPAEFAKAFGWANDPAKARLLKLDP